MTWLFGSVQLDITSSRTLHRHLTILALDEVRAMLPGNPAPPLNHEPILSGKDTETNDTVQ